MSLLQTTQNFRNLLKKFIKKLTSNQNLYSTIEQGFLTTKIYDQQKDFPFIQ